MTALTALFHRSSGPAAVRPGDILGDALRTVDAWYERARQRRELANLPPELLKDIGIDDVDVMIESRKAFWEE